MGRQQRHERFSGGFPGEEPAESADFADFDFNPGRGRGMGSRRGGGHEFAYGAFGGPWRDFPVGGGYGNRGGRRRGPRVGRGEVRFGILTLLAEEPMHGYQIIQEFSNRSGGVWRPSPGSIYPTLSALEDEGLIRPEERDGKKVFQLTEAGIAEVESAADRPAPWDEMAASASTQLIALRNELFQLGSAAMQVAQTGNKDQVERARQLLVATRKKIYLLLAEDSEDPDESGDAD